LTISSVLAATLTTVWVWIDPELQPLTAPGEAPENNTSNFVSQLKLGTEANTRVINNNLALAASNGPKLEYSDKSEITERITELLQLAIDRPNALYLKAEFPSRLLMTALNMWMSGNIVITVSNRQLFAKAGLDDSWSFSEYCDGKIRVTAGFLEECEIQLFSDRLHEGFAYQ
jgi:hypothetical protein